MFRIVHKSDERFAVDKHIVAARVRLKRIRTATCRMNARIAFANRIQTVNEYVVRAAYHRTRTNVSATGAAMRIAHDQSHIRNSDCSFHRDSFPGKLCPGHSNTRLYLRKSRAARGESNVCRKMPFAAQDPQRMVPITRRD